MTGSGGGARRRVLVVFVDALGPAQLDRFGDRLGFLPHRRALTGALGYTSGILPTILTGSPPSVHGRMCLFSRRREDEPSLLAPLAWLGLLPRIVHERGRIRRALAAALAKAHGLTGYVALHRVPPEAFRWLDLPERDDLFLADRVGPARTFLADARAAGLSVVTAAWQFPEDRRWALAFDQMARLRPDLTFLHAGDLDGELHRRGNGDDAVDGVIDRIAARIAHAREIAAEDGASVTTIAVGDHGMADVREAIDPRPILAKMAVDRAFVDSTMIRVWGDDAALSRARRALEAAGIGGAWLDRAALRDRQVPMDGAPYGQALWLLPEGRIFAPSFLGGRVRGMHGYDLGARSSLSALASDDPAALASTSIADVAGIVRARLGLSDSRSTH